MSRAPTKFESSSGGGIKISVGEPGLPVTYGPGYRTQQKNKSIRELREEGWSDQQIADLLALTVVPARRIERGGP